MDGPQSTEGLEGGWRRCGAQSRGATLHMPRGSVVMNWEQRTEPRTGCNAVKMTCVKEELGRNENTDSIKDRNGRDLREAKDIKKRWQEYTDKLYKKDLHDPDNHDGVITDLEPDILECEVKWALGSITTNKASGGHGIPVEIFQILKDDAVKVLHSLCQQIWKAQQWPQDWKRSVFIPIPKKDNAGRLKLPHNCAYFIC